MPITRTLTPSMTGRVKFATSTAPRLPLADLVSNLTPPGQISHDQASLICGQLGREPSSGQTCGLVSYYKSGYQNGQTVCERSLRFRDYYGGGTTASKSL